MAYKPDNVDDKVVKKTGKAAIINGSMVGGGTAGAGVGTGAAFVVGGSAAAAAGFVIGATGGIALGLYGGCKLADKALGK